MYNDIEQVINENLTLKKAYQLSKAHQDQTQKQLNQLKQKFEALNQNYAKVSAHNDQLYQRNKRMQTELGNNNASFVSQIQQLKSLIQQKQNQLQNFQLKMIPSLDQDMIRVKLIAEMEGPYQQAVQKKERQISKLKDQLHQLRRDKQILEFSLNNKQKDFKKQLQQTKHFYENQIDRLSKQLSHLSVKSNSGKIQKQLIRSYRTEIDQLKSACQFHKNTEDELREQLIKLRLQRQKLLGQLATAHSQKAIQIRSMNNNEGLVKSLKDNIIKLEDELMKCQQQMERLKSKSKGLESEKKKLQSNYESELKDFKLSWEKQRESMKNQISDYKQQIRKLRDYKSRQQTEYLAITQKYKLAINTQDRLNQQITNMKIRLNINDQSSTSRYKRSDQIDYEKTTREKIEKQVRQKIERQYKFKIQENYKKQEENRKRRESPKRQDDELDITNKDRGDKGKIKILEQKIKKLTIKLQFANKKILQLLRQKAHRSDSGTGNTDIGRSRSISYSPEHDYHHILLEHRDCSFVPMCPPVIMQHLEHIRPF